MHYDFPIIHHIDDVLPAIEGRDEFVVAERDGFKVVNYNVGYEDTFTIDVQETMKNHGFFIPKGLMRRECRGLIFYPDGRIMSRPFHKFFNVGEREETLLHNIDMSRDHAIVEKMDGSMIRPMMVNGKLRLGTKMGVTDTSIAAENYLHTRPDWAELSVWMEGAVKMGVTPLFEFIAPDNRIVIEYNDPDLVLLAIRHNESGNYLVEQNSTPASLTRVPSYGAVDGSFEDYIARQRGKEGREGDIIRFADGHMLKIKNDWYVRIHKVKDKIRSDRHVLALLLENDLDDVYPHLDENDFNRIKKYEADFHVALHRKVVDIEFKARDAWLAANFNKKELATKILPKSYIARDDWPIVFRYADGIDDFYELVMGRARKGLGNTAKYNELAHWLGLNEDDEENS